MSGQDPIRMFLQRARQSGRMPGGGGAGLAGSGLLIALVAGGLALNASLFNGAQLARVLLTVTKNIFCSGWWSQSYQIYKVCKCRLHYGESPTNHLVFRLHGVGAKIYNEGTHLMVGFRYTYYLVCMLISLSFLGSKLLSSTTSVQSRGILPA